MKKFIGYEYNQNTCHHIFWILFFKFSIRDKVREWEKTNKYLVDKINEIGADKLQPAKGELRQWQLELLELMKTFDKICKENGVQYWLDFGTLLGAVRHKGFIPWDDDIDTSMLKSDLDKILPVLKEHFKGSNFIVRERAITCNNFQIRIRHRQYNLGIDIFQVYEYTKNNLTVKARKEITNKIIKARNIFEKKYRAKFMNKNTVKLAKKEMCKIHEKYIAPLNTKGNILIHGLEFPYLKNEYVTDYDFIFPLIETEFEGYKFYVPNKSEEYLESLWKNWRDIPSEIVSRFEHYYPDYKNSKITYKDNE